MKPRYMIHAMPERMWYVRDFLIPSLLKQGIPKSRIKVWCDREHDGNLLSCMSSFLWCGEQKNPGATWHLQDDVIPKKYMSIYTEAWPVKYPVLCGFCADLCYGEDRSIYDREVTPDKMWWSFQCIRIDDTLAGECARWYFDHDDDFREELMYLIREGKGDDSIFEEFMRTRHPDEIVYNLRPNLVQHVDDLLGGSVVNKDRDFPIRAKYWTDDGEMDDLQRWLERRKSE